MNPIQIETVVTNPLLHELGGLPKRASEGAAAIDLVACIERPVVIEPQKTHRFDLGFRIFIKDPAWAGFVLPRSGLGSRGLVLANSIGLIDSDYQGPLTAVALNRLPKGEDPIVVNPGDRIFQICFLPVAMAALLEVGSFTASTGRGEGGYGSTGA